jgi:DNA-binding response OmpR family regulator
MSCVRVLHVEDEEFLREYVRRVLDDGYEIINAGSLVEANDIFREQDIDLVLLDLVLPDGSGLDLVDTIRDVDARMPVLVFSAHEVTEQILGINGVIVKGTPPEQMLDRIEGCLTRG